MAENLTKVFYLKIQELLQLVDAQGKLLCHRHEIIKNEIRTLQEKLQEKDKVIEEKEFQRVETTVALEELRTKYATDMLQKENELHKKEQEILRISDENISLLEEKRKLKIDYYGSKGEWIKSEKHLNSQLSEMMKYINNLHGILEDNHILPDRETEEIALKSRELSPILEENEDESSSSDDECCRRSATKIHCHDENSLEDDTESLIYEETMLTNESDQDFEDESDSDYDKHEPYTSDVEEMDETVDSVEISQTDIDQINHSTRAVDIVTVEACTQTEHVINLVDKASNTEDLQDPVQVADVIASLTENFEISSIPNDQKEKVRLTADLMDKPDRHPKKKKTVKSHKKVHYKTLATIAVY